jgi:hypothetical protein
MALAKGMGPGGRIARAENKVDKAKDKLGKAVSKYRIASTDSPSEYYKKKDNQAKGDVKVGKAVAKVDKAKGKLTTATRKVAEKAEAKYDKAKAKKSDAMRESMIKFADKASKSMKSDKGQFKVAKDYIISQIQRKDPKYK